MKEEKISRKQMKKLKNELIQKAIKEKDSLKLQYPPVLLMHSVDKASRSANILTIVIIVLTLILIGIGILGFTQGIKINSNGNIEVGRYEIFQGPYRVEDMENNKTYEHNVLFKLDTKTGEVWRYHVSITPASELLEGWITTEFIRNVPAERKD